MSFHILKFALSLCAVSLVCGAATGQPTISLVPVGNHPGGGLDRGSVIIGNEIKLTSGGRNVFLEARVSDWDPDGSGLQLAAYQFFVDAGGYSNEFAGKLQRNATTSCSEDTDCATLFGDGSLCNLPQKGCFSDLSECDICQGGFIDQSRPDFVMQDIVIICASDLATADTRAGCAVLVDPAPSPKPFPANDLYLGTVVVEVPPDVRGSFTINLLPFPETSLIDQKFGIIESVVVPAVITVEHPPTNRYLAVTASTDVTRAIRVTYDELSAPFDTLNGRSMWVGQPYEISESAEDNQPGVPTYEDFFVATLQCEPLFTNWSQFGLIQVFDRNIIPNAAYTIEFFDEGEPPTPAADVEPLVVRTSPWGDLVGEVLTGDGRNYWTAPDGEVNIPSDVLSMIETFVGKPGAPRKIRVDLDPEIPDGRIYIIDVLRGIGAFMGLGFPFEAQPFPCE